MTKSAHDPSPSRRSCIGSDLARTIRAGLEVLPARLAAQVADAGLLVDLDGDGGLVAAEEAAEGGREGFALKRMLARQSE